MLDKAGLVPGTARDVRRQECPRPALGNADRIPFGHGELAAKLTEYQLLASLGGDALKEQLRRGPGIQVRQEAVDAGLAPARELLVEVDVLPDFRDGVVVVALLGCLRAEHVGQDGGVADFLVGHVCWRRKRSSALIP